MQEMQETWVQFLGWEDSLKEEIVTPSNILVWKISWIEEPGSPLSMGSQRVVLDWATEHITSFCVGFSLSLLVFEHLMTFCHFTPDSFVYLLPWSWNLSFLTGALFHFINEWNQKPPPGCLVCLLQWGRHCF